MSELRINKLKHRSVLSNNPLIAYPMNKENKSNKKYKLRPKSVIRNIFIKIRSKYDFSNKTFFKMKINQLTNPKSNIYNKFVELLLSIDSEEFLRQYYFTDTIQRVLPTLTLDYSNNYRSIPNYFSLNDKYSFLMNWLNLKQKGIYNDNDNCNINNIGKSNESKRCANYKIINDSINKIGKSSFSLDTDSRDNKNKQSINYEFNSIGLSVNSNKNLILKDSIDSIIDFAKYIDELEYRTKEKKEYNKRTIPKKKMNTRTLFKSKTVINNKIIVIDEPIIQYNYNDNQIIEPKTTPLKNDYCLSKTPVIIRSPKAQFVPTKKFIEKMNQKNLSKFSFNYKSTKEIEKMLFNIKSAINLTAKPVLFVNSNSSSQSRSNIKVNVMKKMNQNLSLPYFDLMHYKQKILEKNLVLDTTLMDKIKGIKDFKSINSNSNSIKKKKYINLLIPLTTSTKRKVNNRLNSAYNSNNNIHSVNSSNTNKFAKLKVTFDSFVIANYT